MHKSLINTIKITTISVYLIFIAGTDFKKGVIIIKNEALYVAKKQITTSTEYNPKNWKNYTKHEYAIFNVYHTWTEYINRLSSVLSGFIFLFLLIKVTFNKNKVKGVATLVYLAFLGMLFEAWLGKIVVDSYLSPYIITFHMIGGLLIIGFLLRARFLIEKNIISTPIIQKTETHKWFKLFLTVSLLMMITQILLGTQVRQFVDEQVKAFGFTHKEFRLLNPSFKFYFQYNAMNWIAGLLFCEAFTGILMYYVNFPFGTQAIHLLSGALLYGILLFLFFTVNIHGPAKNN